MKPWQRGNILRKSERLALEKKSKHTGIPVTQLHNPKHIAKKSRT